MITDITTREHVIKLVDSFYGKVKKNILLGYIFNEVAKVDWSHHLPRMYAFWSSILLGDSSYDGNPMTVHLRLSKQTPLTQTEFDEWLRLFNETVDEHFSGPNAVEAKTRAGNIARLMLFKIQSLGG